VIFTLKRITDLNEWKDGLNCVLHGDCLELMRLIPDKTIDLVLTDPPYGLGESGGSNHSRGLLAKPTLYKALHWDKKPPDAQIFNEIFRVSKHQIIFGGNHFLEYLKNTSSFIVWDKDNYGTNFADCELAWTSHKKAVRKFKWRWNGMLQEDMANKERRQHPTQKPLELARWCLENYAKDCKTIFDPFAGSFTFARAAKDMGFDFLSCDLEEDYCRIGVERLKQEVLF